MTTPPNLPVVEVYLNATSLKTTHCSLRYNLTVTQGYRSAEEAEALNFGKGVHKFAELSLKGVGIAEALAAASNIYVGTNTAKFAESCMSFMQLKSDLHPARDDNGPLIERKFFFLWREVAHEGTLYRIYLCGTLDCVVEMSDDTLIVHDWKTARKWKTQDVFYMYRLSVQLRFYLWILFAHGHQFLSTRHANAAHAGKLFARIGGCFISHNPVKWYLGPPMQLGIKGLLAFGDQLEATIPSIIRAWTSPSPDGLVNSTCEKCEYALVCHAENDTLRQQAMDSLVHVPYDPRKW